MTPKPQNRRARRRNRPTAGGGARAARLAASAGVVGAATLASRVLGLVRDQVLAYRFGAEDAMDAFNVASRIPNLMRDLFAEGAMSAAFVPTFMRRLTKDGRPTALLLGNQVVNALIAATGVVVVAGILFAEPLVRTLAADYAAVPGKLELAAALTRILLPVLTLVAVAAAMMGMLNSLGRFFVPALSPAMYNVGIIAGGLLLVPLMPGLGLDPIVAVAVGALLGAVGQVALQVPALYGEGFRYRPTLDPADPGLRSILRLMGPGTLAGAAVQINLLVNMVLAAAEGTGAVSWLSYAFRVMYLPIGLFGVSVAAAAVPLLSRQGAQNDTAGMRDTVSRALRLTLAINVPATVGLMVLGVPIVEVIFERGAFTAADTSATAAALLLYAPGLAGYAAVRIAVPCFYALGDQPHAGDDQRGRRRAQHRAQPRSWCRVLGYRGLALGTSVAALTNALVLLVLLRRRLDGPRPAAGADARRQGRGRVGSDGRRRVDWPTTGCSICGAAPGFAVRLGRLAASIAAGLWSCWSPPRASCASGSWTRRRARSPRGCAVDERLRRTGRPPGRARAGGGTMGADASRIRRRRPLRVRPGTDDAGGPDAPVDQRRHLPLHDARAAGLLLGHEPLRPDAATGPDAAVAVAAGHLHVPARGHRPHPAEHARALDVRHAARAHLGLALLPALLLHHRGGGGRRDDRRRTAARPRSPSRPTPG